MKDYKKIKEQPDNSAEQSPGAGFGLGHEKAGAKAQAEQIIHYQNALLHLAKMDSVDLISDLKRIAEVDAKTLGVERVSVWFFNEDNSILECSCLYRLSTGSFEDNLKLEAKKYPHYFKVLKKSRIIVANDANHDPNTCEFSDSYLKIFGVVSMLDAPIRILGRVAGIVCHEHVGEIREWKAGEQDFVVSIADMVSVVLAADKKRLAEKALRNSEQKYRSLINDASDAILLADIEGNLLEANKAAENLTGYSKKELLNMNFLKIHPEECRDMISNAFREIAAKKKGFLNNACILKKNGEKTFVDITGSMVEFSGKQILQGIFRDVTERRKFEESLRSSELQYRRILDSVGDLIHVVDGELRIILLNEQFKKFNKELGIDSNIIGKTIFEAFAFLPHKVKSEYDKVFKTGEVLVTEEKNNISGREIITETRKIPVFENSKVVQVLTVIRDITDRKLFEENLKISEGKFRTVVENIPLHIGAIDRRGKFYIWNKFSEAMLGYKAEEAIGRLTPRDIHEHKKDADRAIRIAAKKGIFDGDLNFVRKDGSKFPVHLTVLVDKDEEGKIKNYYGIAQDISDRYQAQVKLEALNRELLSSNRRLKQFALKDQQTGLFNHRFLSEVIESEFFRSQRYMHSLSLIMIDVDYFKSINEVYGHQFGDLVLKQLAKQLKKEVRQYDLVVRYGGEEFVILSPGSDRGKALAMSERILNSINLFNFGNKKHLVKLKLSIAVASYPEDNVMKGMDLVELSELILNSAKEHGGGAVYSALDLKDRKTSSAEPVPGSEDVKALKDKIDKLTKQANQSLVEAILAFGKTIELKDHYTGEHVERTVQYATDIAKGLGLPKDEIERIRKAAMLHDLGKVGISDKILLKKAKLTKLEYDKIKKHPQIAIDILRPIQFLHDIVPLVFYHHERWDGKGYPNGLKQEEIPIGARIIALADVYQALISDRPYRKAYSKQDVIEILKQESGAKFDPKIVNIFLDILEREK